MCSQWARWRKTFSNRFLKILTERTVTTEAGSLFQHFTSLTQNADPLLRRWLAPWSTLKGCPLRVRRVGGRKTISEQYPKGPKSSSLGCRPQVRLVGHLSGLICLLMRFQSSALRPLCTENACTLAGSIVCQRTLQQPLKQDSSMGL